MECMVASLYSPAVAILRPSLTYTSSPRTNKFFGLRAQLCDDNDPLLLSAIDAASLRFQETHRPEPLFVDPYAGCFVSAFPQWDMKKSSHHYSIATKFIDDKLLRTVNHMDGLKQVVLLTDGMDTRPYRLNWPSSTIIFDVSPDRVFKRAAEELTAAGAKTPRSCLFLHVPLESSNIQQSLQAKGFNDNQPSIWAIQGLPVMTLASFEEILLTVSSLAMNGCSFTGELPVWLAETEIGTKISTKTWIDKLFMSNGFRVNMVSHEEVARNLGKELEPEDYKYILFATEQLRFSDGVISHDSVKEKLAYELCDFGVNFKMEMWRREFQRVEEEGGEDGFEEL